MKKYFWMICTIMTLVSISIMGLASGAKAEKVKLIFALEDTENTPHEEMIEVFKEQYPDVEITVEEMGLAYTESGQLQLALSAGEGPDLFSIDPTPGRLGVLAKAGLSYPLDEYWSKYNWDQTYLDWTSSTVTYNGQKHGVPTDMDMIGVMYNVNLFEELGYSIPQSYEEFLELCQKLSDNGYIPLALGTRKTWMGGWYFSHFIEAAAGRAAVEDLLYGDGKWTHPGFLTALQEIQKLADKGFFGKDPQALAPDEASNLFYQEKAAMQMIGQWAANTLIAEPPSPDFKASWFTLPPITADSVGGWTGGVGGGLAINAKSKAPDICAAYINLWHSTAKGQELAFSITGGGLKAYKLMIQDINPLWQQINKLASDPRGIGYNLSVFVPAHTKNAYYQALQGVVAKLLDPEDALKGIQKAWEKDVADGNVKKR